MLAETYGRPSDAVGASGSRPAPEEDDRRQLAPGNVAYAEGSGPLSPPDVTERPCFAISKVVGETLRSDADLLAATRAGDAEAFGEFFRRHQDTVLLYVRRRSSDAELAADLTAETFAAALLAVHRGNAAKVTSGAPWLIGIARHKLIDTYRTGAAQDAARKELGLSAVIADDVDLARIDELAGSTADLEAALDTLSASERYAVVERIAREREYEDLAREARQPEFVIRQRVSRGLRRLRHAMGVGE